MESTNFDVLVLCCSVAESEKRRICGAARQQHPSPVIVLLSSLSGLDAVRKGVVFDRIAPTHPASLIACVKELLRQRAQGTQSPAGQEPDGDLALEIS